MGSAVEDQAGLLELLDVVVAALRHRSFQAAEQVQLAVRAVGRAVLVPGVGSDENPKILSNTSTGSNARDMDSEYKLLNYLANIYKGQNPEGTVIVYTELPPCSSCQSVVQQFKNMFPHLDVIIIYA